jgi:hypothetical protein
MRFRDYFIGIPVELASALPPGEIASRINASAASPWNPFARGVTGRASKADIQLRFSSSPLEYNSKPCLRGSIKADGTGSRLRLRYRGRKFSILFFVVWWTALLLVLIGAASAWLAEPKGFDATELIWIPVFAAFPLVVHYIGTANADADLDRLIAFLREEAGAIQKM